MPPFRTALLALLLHYMFKLAALVLTATNPGQGRISPQQFADRAVEQGTSLLMDPFYTFAIVLSACLLFKIGLRLFGYSDVYLISKLTRALKAPCTEDNHDSHGK